jgi:hypothetical protein
VFVAHLALPDDQHTPAILLQIGDVLRVALDVSR